MTILVLALYAEGAVDTRFLPPIIQRTSEIILGRYGQRVIDIPEAIIIAKKHDRLDKCILLASQEAKGCHALLVHNDGDNLGYDGAYKERFAPGLSLVQQKSEGEVCHNLVPIIPIRMIEAWMLADYHALYQVLGTDPKQQASGLPDKVSQVEHITKPKDMLNEIVRKVNTSRSHRRQINLNTKYELLARQIDLNTLFGVPSYREFVIEMAGTLEKLHFIPYGSTSQIASSTYFHI